MRQPFAVLIPRRRLAPNGAWRRGTGRSWRQAKSTDEHAAHRPTLGPQHAVAKRQTTGETLGRRLPHKEGRVRCVHLSSRPSSPRWNDGKPGAPGERKRHRSRSSGQPADRAGLLAALLLAPVAPVALAVAPPL